MLGKTTVFVPGYDHAGISTQSVVEKRLFKITGKTRQDLGREKFLDTVLAWKNEWVLTPTFEFRVHIKYVLQLPGPNHRPDATTRWQF